MNWFYIIIKHGLIYKYKYTEYNISNPHSSYFSAMACFQELEILFQYCSG